MEVANCAVEGDPYLKVRAWVGSEVLPHEAHVRAWLRRALDPSEVEDVIQEAYCRISSLESIDHIQNGRAYLFATARALVFERIRRSRVVNFESVAEIESLNVMERTPSPERVAAGRRELARVRRLIEGLPERCRRIFELRKIEGLSQREVASTMGVAEYIVENDVAKGLKLILKAMMDSDRAAEEALAKAGNDGRARDTTGDL
jgi:RNA polymerase sigma-70 factor (ECF subfamily)